MSKADTKNAHIRSQTKKQKEESFAEGAHRLLSDPAFREALKRLKDQLVNSLTSTQHDGSENMDNYERETCRMLRTMSSFERLLTMALQGQDLRQANFRAVYNGEDEEVKH